MEYIERLKENITVLQEQYNKKVVPIRAITINKNKKKDYSENLSVFWKTYDLRCSTKYLLDLIEIKNIVGFGIATGKENNIIVVDWDNKPTTNKDFLNKLHEQNTLTIKTAGDGFHFIFKYSDLFRKNAKEIFNNVDIRTNGGLIFHGIREDGFYDIYNNEKIKPLNDVLINELLNNINQENIIKKEKKAHAEGKGKKAKKEKYNDNKIYDITDEEIRTLLDLLPKIFLTDYNEWIKPTHILKKIDKKQIWDEWSKQNKEKYDKEKNEIIWDNAKENETYNNDLYYLIWLVKFYNKDIQIKQIERIYKEYEEIDETNKKNAKYIHRDFLNVGDIDEKKKLNLIKSPTGSAKTTTAINYAKEEIKNNQNLKIVSITHLITIADDHHNRFNKEGLKMFHYKEAGSIISIEYLNDYDFMGVVVVINSLIKFLDFDFSNSIIYLDEINAVIECLLNSSVLKNRREIINIFIKILNEAKIIIATDATITNLTYDFLKRALGEECEDKINFVINTYQNGNNVPCYFIEDFNKIEDLIKEDLNNNDCFMGCFNSKRKTDDLHALIKTLKIEYSERIVKITSAHGEKINNVNEEWADKISLFSPSIVQGIDYNPENPINVYCFVFGDTTLNPIQVSQQIARNRKPKNIYIFIEGCENRLYYKGGLKQVQNEFNNMKKLNDTIYKDFLNTRTEGIKTIREENELTELFYKYKLNEDILKSSFKYNLKIILKNKGCRIIDNIYYKKIEKTRQEKKTIKDKTKQIKEDEINKKFDDYINNRLKDIDKYKILLDSRIKSLNLIDDMPKTFDFNDKRILEEYKEILNNETLFKSFINIIFYLCKNTKNNNIKVQQRNIEDYSHHTFKEIPSFIKTYKRLLITYTPNINPYYYCYNEYDYKDEKINLSKEDFNIIKTLTATTRAHPKTTIEFLRIMKIIAKKIFGDIIQQKNKTIRNNKEVKNYSTILFNEYAFFKALNHIKLYSNGGNICPYISKLIYNNDFENIDPNNIKIEELLLSDDEKSVKSTETEDNKSTTSENKILLLPYEKININILVEDIKNNNKDEYLFINKSDFLKEDN